MKFSLLIAGSTIATLVVLSGNTRAQQDDVWSVLEESGLFRISESIGDQRESSTENFEFLDENQSGSITLDEIEVFQTEEERAELTSEELRKWNLRRRIASDKFWRRDPETKEFAIVDLNNDGSLSEEEYDGRAQAISSHRLEIGFREVDADGNGGVELHEFNSFLNDLEIYDLNKDGTVSAAEARKSNDPKILRGILEPLNPVDILTRNMTVRLKEASESLEEPDDGKKD